MYVHVSACSTKPHVSKSPPQAKKFGDFVSLRLIQYPPRGRGGVSEISELKQNLVDLSANKWIFSVFVVLSGFEVP